MHTTEVRRDEDYELMGYLRPEGADQWSALTVFGGVLAGPTTQEEAESAVQAEGLSSLADHWWVDLGDGWYDCELQEAAPGFVRLWVNATDFPDNERRRTLTGSVDEVLRRRTPVKRR